MNQTPDFADSLRAFAKIGLLSFGGPAGQIALMHKEFVDERKWLSEDEFLKALNFCMLLPGPEAMQLATYAGWKLHGVKGGLAAGILFVLPGAALILALSLLYIMFGRMPLTEALFWGIKCAVVAIVFEALLKVARKALREPLDWWLAILAFVAIFVFALPFPLVVAAAAVVGFFQRRPLLAAPNVVARPRLIPTLKTIATWLVVWLVPLGFLFAVFGPGHVQTELARMFSILAVVTFGGAYVVLASLGQTVVEQMGWLTPQQMMDGFGLAETTPGPLILVGQFVGFMAAAHVQNNLWAGVLASLVFLWMTFAPCFLWIFAGAPWLQFISAQPRLASALAAITAAVAGVILNLALWFALHVIFTRVERLPGLAPVWWPDLGGFDGAALLLCVLLGLALIRWKVSIPKLLAFGLLAGLIWKFIIPVVSA